MPKGGQDDKSLMTPSNNVIQSRQEKEYEDFQSENLSDEVVVQNKIEQPNQVVDLEPATPEKQKLLVKIVSKSKKNIIILDNMWKIGSEEHLMLKYSVIYNTQGTPKMYARDSLFFCNAQNRLRKQTIKIIESKVFEYFILTIIFLNTISLSMYDYSDRNSLTKTNMIIDIFNFAFSVIYTIEAAIRITALGFVIHKKSYLRDPWNLIDFFVVLSGLIELIFAEASQSLKTLRAIRVLRPLKSINSLPSIRKQVHTLVASIPSFFRLALFLLIIYIILAIFGLQYYGTSFYNRCRFNPEPEIPGKLWEIDKSITRACSLYGYGTFNCPKGRYCGNPIEKGIPLESENIINNGQIYYGITTFDNIGTSILIINQIVSTDNWSSYIYNMMDVADPLLGASYGLIVIVFGYFFVMNLILAVIIDTFIQLQDEDFQKEMLQQLGETVQFEVDDEEINFFQVPEKCFAKHGHPIENKQSVICTSSPQKEAINELKSRTPSKVKSSIKIKGESPYDHHFGSSADGTNNKHSSKKHERSHPKTFEDEDQLSETAARPLRLLKLGNQNEDINSNSLRKPEASQIKILPEQDENFQAKQNNGIDPIANEDKKNIMIFAELKEKTKQHLNVEQDENQQQVVLKKLLVIQQLQEKTQNQLLINNKQQARAQKNKIYYISLKIAKSFYFSIFIQICIAANTTVLALDTHPKIKGLEENQQSINNWFGVVFVAELILKLLGTGFKHYFSDPFNVFDSVIVITTIFDIATSLAGTKQGGLVSALRAFRVIRVFKLARAWKRFHFILRTTWKTLVDVSTFTIVLFLFMIIFTILGMELFAYKAKFNDKGVVDLVHGQSIRQNFDSFIWSFTSVFIVLTSDSWSVIWFAYFRALKSWVVTAYIQTIFYLGNRILLNLFLAILLQNFDEDSIEQELKKEISGTGQQDQPPSTLSESQNITSVVLIQSSFDKFAESFKRGCVGKCLENMKHKIMQSKCWQERMITKPKAKKTPILQEQGHKVSTNRDGPNKFGDDLPESESERKQLQNIPEEEDDDDDIFASESQEEEFELNGTSLFIFDEDNKFRKKMFKILTHAWFERTMILAIIVSSVQIALGRPLNDPNGILQKILDNIDLATTIIFTFEGSIKIVSVGFYWCGETSYLRTTWNILDFIIMIFSLVSLIPASQGLQIFKMFRIMRALRLISRNEGLKVGLQALIKAIPNVFKIVSIMVLFFLMFGIVAVSFFKGTFYYCEYLIIQPTLSQFPQTFTVNNKWDCLNAGALWMNKSYNFDNIINAMVSLFVMCNVSSWQDFMYICAQVTEIDWTWKQWTQSYWVFFFIAFMVVGSFFLLNLFVGVVISSFNRQKDLLGGNSLLTEKQKEWIDTHLVVLKAQPEKKFAVPQNIIRKLCYHIQNHQSFRKIVFICILGNLMILCIKWQGESRERLALIEMINDGFTLLFALEAAIKIVGLGQFYFKNRSNQFDFVILLISLISLIVYNSFRSIPAHGGPLYGIFVTIRVIKSLRLFRYASSFKHFFNTFVISIPPLMNIGSLLLLILYIYTIAGVLIFGQVKRTGKASDNLNFESFEKGALTLFVIASTDAWPDIAASYLRTRSPDYHCIDNPQYSDYVAAGMKTVGCGTGPIGLLFFISFFLLMSLIMLKLFIAVILQSYNEIKIKQNRLFNDEILEAFKNTWKDLDPEATGYLDIESFRIFLTLMGPPLGFEKEIPEEYLSEFSSLGLAANSALARQQYEDKHIESLNLTLHKDNSHYSFVDVLDALSLRIMIIEQAQKMREEQQHSRGPHQEDLEEISSQSNKNNNNLEEEEIQKSFNVQSGIGALFKKEYNRFSAEQQVSDDNAALRHAGTETKGLQGVIGNAILSKTKTKIKIQQDNKTFQELQNELIGEIKMLAEDQRASKIHAVKQIQKIKAEQTRSSAGGIMENNMLAALSQTVKVQIHDQIQSKNPLIGLLTSQQLAVSKATAEPEGAAINHHDISTSPGRAQAVARKESVNDNESQSL